jgi:hypothetical protein
MEVQDTGNRKTVVRRREEEKCKSVSDFRNLQSLIEGTVTYG